mmetsp:Transcript_32383/g.69300  ORF Transcript_32383/g.69300 Transcript_32383/m.69300 type:complete len:356 (+) Transcript_32383:460-1527(+)
MLFVFDLCVVWGVFLVMLFVLLLLLLLLLKLRRFNVLRRFPLVLLLLHGVGKQFALLNFVGSCSFHHGRLLLVTVPLLILLLLLDLLLHLLLFGLFNAFCKGCILCVLMAVLYSNLQSFCRFWCVSLSSLMLLSIFIFLFLSIIVVMCLPILGLMYLRLLIAMVVMLRFLVLVFGVMHLTRIQLGRLKLILMLQAIPINIFHQLLTMAVLVGLPVLSQVLLLVLMHLRMLIFLILMLFSLLMLLPTLVLFLRTRIVCPVNIGRALCFTIEVRNSQCVIDNSRVLSFCICFGRSPINLDVTFLFLLVVFGRGRLCFFFFFFSKLLLFLVRLFSGLHLLFFMRCLSLLLPFVACGRG